MLYMRKEHLIIVQNNNPVGSIVDDSTELGLSSACVGTRIFLKDNVSRVVPNPIFFWIEHEK